MFQLPIELRVAGKGCRPRPPKEFQSEISRGAGRRGGARNDSLEGLFSNQFGAVDLELKGAVFQLFTLNFRLFAVN